jgi:hypothetical protein
MRELTREEMAVVAGGVTPIPPRFNQAGNGGDGVVPGTPGTNGANANNSVPVIVKILNANNLC